MAIIKLHGSPLSANAQRALLCLEEKGVDYEFVLVDMANGAHKKESYLSLNPFGQVPAFEDGDIKLFESRAITNYLAHKYADRGTALLSGDPKKQAIITVWMEVESHSFGVPSAKIYTELVVMPMFGRATNEAVVEENQEKLAKVLDVYEDRLSKSKYLGGESFSLADLHHIPILNALFTTKVRFIFESRPHVNAWCDDILSRPAWRKVLGALNFNN